MICGFIISKGAVLIIVKTSQINEHVVYSRAVGKLRNVGGGEGSR